MTEDQKRRLEQQLRKITNELRGKMAADEDLLKFPHVNGSLFTETLRPAQFDSDAREALLNAHQRLDKGVDACYGRRTFTTELERVTYLFELYQQLTAPLAKAPPVKAGAS